MGEDDAPTGVAATELGQAIDQTAPHTAWSLDSDEEEWPRRRLTPGRITALAVTCSAALFAAAVTLALIYLPDDNQAATPRPSEIAATPTTTPPLVQPPPLPEALNGTYEVFYDWAKTTSRGGETSGGGDVKWKFTHATPRAWIAFSTACTAAECIATGNPLQDDRRTPLDVGPLVLRLIDGSWGDIAPRQVTNTCTNPNTGAKLGASTVTQDFSLDPKPDGSRLTGTLRSVVSSDGCGDDGNTALTPVTVTRLAELSLHA